MKDSRRQGRVIVAFKGESSKIGAIFVDSVTWGAVEWSEKHGVWCIEDAEGACLRHASSIHGKAAAKDEAIALAERLVRDGTLPTPEEAKLEHIIEHVVLNVIAPDDASAEHLGTIIREFTKVALRLNELEPASDSLIDEIAGEMIEWHAPRPDEEGWNPELADAPAAPRLMDWNRRRADIRAQERRAEYLERKAEHEAEHEQAMQQEKFQRQREDAARRRARGDHDGADFIERWIEQQGRAP